MKTDQELSQAGFTPSGLQRYQRTTSEYSEELYSRAIKLGDYDKAPDAQREVTHDHVRSAAESLTRRSREPTGWERFCHISEYVCTLGAGIGGGKLDQTWGVALCIAATAIGLLLIFNRISNAHQ